MEDGGWGMGDGGWRAAVPAAAKLVDAVLFSLRSLRAIHSPLSTIHSPLFTIHYSLFTIHYSLPAVSPAFDQRVWDTELVADARDDEIDEVADLFDAVVEGGRGRQDDGAGLGRASHVVDLH